MENNELIRTIAQCVENTFRIETLYLHITGKQNICRMTGKKESDESGKRKFTKKAGI